MAMRTRRAEAQGICLRSPVEFGTQIADKVKQLVGLDNELRLGWMSIPRYEMPRVRDSRLRARLLRSSPPSYLCANGIRNPNLAYELAHELLHGDIIGDEVIKNHKLIETEAESVAFGATL